MSARLFFSGMLYQSVACISSAYLCDSLQVRYNEFIHAMDENNIQLNRKVLSEIAAQEPFTFRALVELSRQHLGIQRPVQPI